MLCRAPEHLYVQKFQVTCQHGMACFLRADISCTAKQHIQTQSGKDRALAWPCEADAHLWQALANIAATRLAGDKEVANAEAEWRQLLQLIQQDRKQRVRPLNIAQRPSVPCSECACATRHGCYVLKCDEGWAHIPGVAVVLNTQAAVMHVPPLMICSGLRERISCACLQQSRDWDCPLFCMMLRHWRTPLRLVRCPHHLHCGCRRLRGVSSWLSGRSPPPSCCARTSQSAPGGAPAQMARRRALTRTAPAWRA